MKRLNNQGFSHIIGLVLVIAIIGIASFGAWRISQSSQEATDTSSASGSSVSVPRTLSNKDDVSQARQALENDDTDTSLDDTQLDKDITSLY